MTNEWLRECGFVGGEPDFSGLPIRAWRLREWKRTCHVAIARYSTSLHGHHFVYLLMQGDSILYIGRSFNIAQRLKTHKADGKPFDDVRLIECADFDECAALEIALIEHHQPRLNVAHTKQIA